MHSLNAVDEIDKFSAYMNKTLYNFISKNSCTYTFRDFNIDQTPLSKNNCIHKYVDSLMSSGCKSPNKNSGNITNPDRSYLFK